MPETFLFVFFLLIGWLLRDSLTTPLKEKLKQFTYYILLLFVAISIGKYGIPNEGWLLFLLGILLQIVPITIALFLKNYSASKAFLLFGTYGGGNRGTLVLSILSPAVLPVFILVDLGNFFSLILFYPIFSKFILKGKNKYSPQQSLIYFIVSLFVIITGIILNFYTENIIPDEIYSLLKILLISSTSFQIGIYLFLDKQCLIWSISWLLIVRSISLIIPIITAFIFLESIYNDIFIVLVLFSILPISSLVVSLQPENLEEKFNRQTSCAISASFGSFILLLILFFLFFYFLD